MKTHKRIIGICWIIFGVSLLSLILMSLESSKTQTIVISIAEGLLFLGAGFSLVANLRHSSWVCLPCSALSLFIFPIGTVIGAYYLWFHFKVERAQ